MKKKFVVLMALVALVALGACQSEETNVDATTDVIATDTAYSTTDTSMTMGSETSMTTGTDTMSTDTSATTVTETTATTTT